MDAEQAVGGGMDETKVDMSWWLTTLTDGWIRVPYTIFSTFLCVILICNKRKPERNDEVSE